jgi:hypothetical protein
MVSGDTISVDYATEPPPRVPSTKVTWTLKRSGDDLEGEGIRQSDMGRFSMKLKRAK